MSDFYVPSGPGQAEYEEKRSRFIGQVMPVESEEEARAFIAEVKKKYYDARHNCWCYIIRNGAERYSDDGEPQGTAGVPMLEVFRKEKVSGVVCVVTRYFGGVLLGAGGLLRAYTRSAKDALAAAGVSVLRPWVSCELSCAYAMAERLKAAAESLGGYPDGTDYAAEVSLRFLVEENNYQSFSDGIFDRSGGSVRPVKTGTVLKAVPR